MHAPRGEKLFQHKQFWYCQLAQYLIISLWPSCSLVFICTDKSFTLRRRKVFTTWWRSLGQDIKQILKHYRLLATNPPQLLNIKRSSFIFLLFGMIWGRGKLVQGVWESPTVSFKPLTLWMLFLWKNKQIRHVFKL